MGMETYKQSATITSQLYFCSSPIRLDAYNRCQFGCVYCFSRNRQSDITNRAIKKASHSAFEKRLTKVSKGQISSALDEFLERRVPIQLGGLFDPFTPVEEKTQESLRLMECLRDYQYPTLISTKGNILTKTEYIEVLKQMNVHIRISAAGIAEKFRSEIDIGCDSFKNVLDKIKFLSENGLSTSLRIQPVIPGFENDALAMTEQAARAGVSHVSYEYLKVTAESRDQELRKVYKTTGVNIWDKMKTVGLTIVGRDYTLNKSAKWDFLLSAKKLCANLGIKFGAGDTEFIHLSDGSGCCNSSEFFLKDASQFRTNFVGVLSKKKNTFTVKFSDLKQEWVPQHNIHRYLTTNSRSRDTNRNYPSLLSLLSYRWNGGKGPYSPAFFYGVSWNSEYDDEGYKIYHFENPFKNYFEI
jgi:DNA repair photolyase